ncbi:beta-lactamase regulator AmpE [Shewanella vesiculosa]|uniref:beta-lactamase regulator AmpE n=1 Tax=Shewanella vesiculosa TaxID=518738 RepID=UPI000F504A4A|nr:beta-lactamase regulator AmpE [Shewanella vesiculosa]RPA56299.1 beta-lactamase regulator AmpE [Shewanella vesiculosa]UJL42229.1 beta-lactamase regulator AmpE [Shewanella vesiculosa]
MALFSLLVAILVERLKLLPSSWQFDTVMMRYQKQFWDSQSLKSEFGVAVALVLPAISVFLISVLLDGILFDLLSLLFWVLISIICFSHQTLRIVFKQYIQAACRGDVQACYRYASELDSTECLDVVDEQDLGRKVGQTVAWINYRYYGAVALYLIFLGPVGAILYCSVRFYSEYNSKNKLEMPLVDHLQMLFDWLPSRVFSFGYVLSGQFSEGLSAWRQYGLSVKTDAKTIVTYTAVAAESLPEAGNAPLSVQSTLALLALSKRNFVLLLTMVSVLTIFGLVS